MDIITHLPQYSSLYCPTLASSIAPALQMVMRSILQDWLSALSTDFLTLFQADIVRDITLHNYDRADAAPHTDCKMTSGGCLVFQSGYPIEARLGEQCSSKNWRDRSVGLGLFPSFLLHPASNVGKKT